METTEIRLERLRQADYNDNHVSASVRAKIRRSIERYGVVENLVACPHPVDEGSFELLSDNHRLRAPSGRPSATSRHHGE